MNPITLVCRLGCAVLLLVAVYMGCCSYAAFGDPLISTVLAIAALCVTSCARDVWRMPRHFE
jgi:membrane protein YdbS with pleckstrin-like domain